MPNKHFEDGSLEAGAGILAVIVVVIFAVFGIFGGFWGGILAGLVVYIGLKVGAANFNQGSDFNFILGSAQMLSKAQVNVICKQNRFPSGISDFVAIDFETANNQAHSACSLGLVVVKSGEVTTRKSWLINPNTKIFTFSHLHGITYEMVKNEPKFDDIWPDVHELIKNEYLVAHNMVFDYGVLQALVRRYSSIKLPNHRLICSLELARARINLPSYKLNHVCAHLGIDLDHHDALSDAEAAAKIVLRLG